ncbi:hypothetical protein HHK36_000160 [Tetracentron sinense]|uniref:Glutaminyl-peptide cyclotransferase n=1 Tax=Tetracentron sinense TaxID=13715 RepID=A0A834ZV08_TETSI|nr:hypothetical protein HHK36_000160 [Tetracentron sinense]
MASGSLKKKKPKRSSFQPHSSMASRSSPFNYSRGSLIVSSLLVFCILLILYISSNNLKKSTFGIPSTQIYSIEVLNEFPHDPKAFTQGLLYGGNDTLFESTGQYGEISVFKLLASCINALDAVHDAFTTVLFCKGMGVSSVRKVALQTGKVEILQKMDGSYFGEGLTLFDERLFQVVWLERTGFIYDRYNLKKFEKFTHQMRDGWGLATDGKVLFGSDGSSTLYQLDPRTLKVIGKETVKYKGHEVYNLNELEYINGEVWANVWQTDCIARIAHKDGTVLGWILLHNLRENLIKAGNTHIDVLNGIAWDSDNNRLFVTGKLWPKLYEIKLHPVRGPVHGAIEKICLRNQFHFGEP